MQRISLYHIISPLITFRYLHFHHNPLQEISSGLPNDFWYQRGGAIYGDFRNVSETLYCREGSRVRESAELDGFVLQVPYYKTSPLMPLTLAKRYLTYAKNYFTREGTFFCRSIPSLVRFPLTPRLFQDLISL